MEKHEFETLRKLPSKLIIEDLRFTQHKRIAAGLTTGPVKIINGLGEDLILNATLKPDFPSVSFNFSIAGTGPICRYDINGTEHKDEGRTHKHSLQHNTCPAKNVPHAKERTEFQIDGANIKSSVEYIWAEICREANLLHEGKIVII